MKASELCQMHTKLFMLPFAIALASCNNGEEQIETSRQLDETTNQAANPNLYGNGIHVIEGTILKRI